MNIVARRARVSENNEDLALAEKWLREQAQAQGWAKAQKLQVITKVSFLDLYRILACLRPNSTLLE
jgi:hypothetical protein